jgi:hypothetical protein
MQREGRFTSTFYKPAPAQVERREVLCMFCEHVSSDQRDYTRKERDVLYNTFYKPAAPAQVERKEVLCFVSTYHQTSVTTHAKRGTFYITHSTNQQHLHRWRERKCYVL